MSEDTRATLTIGLWFLSALVLGALFISAAAQGELTAGHLVFAFTLLSLAIAGTVYLLRGFHNESQQGKVKRQRRLDSVLRDMSDEELVELRRRLTDSYSGEESLGDALGDDGEIVRRR